MAGHALAAPADRADFRVACVGGALPAAGSVSRDRRATTRPLGTAVVGVPHTAVPATSVPPSAMRHPSPARRATTLVSRNLRPSAYNDVTSMSAPSKSSAPVPRLG